MADTLILDPVDSPGRTNLITNPSFETNTTGWAAYSGATANRTTPAGVPSGSYGLGITTPGAAVREGTVTSLITVSASTTYTAAVWVYANTGVRGEIRLLSYTAASAFVTATTVAFTGNNAWQRVSVTQAFGATSVRAEIYVVASNAAPAQATTMYVDAAQLVAESSASTYFDGNTQGSTPASTYAWTGTPHASSSTVTVDRTQLDITEVIANDGIDWGDAEIAAFLAEQTLGDVAIGYRTPNRTVRVPLRLKATASNTFDQWRQKIQAKAALIQREGGWLRRERASGVYYADVVKCTLKMNDSWYAKNQSADPDAELILECIPDFYEDEITIASNTAAGEINVVKTAIKGNVPGRLRVKFDEGSANDQRGLIVGLRSKKYSAAATAALTYEAEALTPMDTAAIATVTGFSGGASNNGIQHSNLATSWTAVMNTNLLAGTFLTHEGTYRMWARVRSTSATPPKIRAVYDVGDLALPEENDAYTIPGANNAYLADLGQVRLDKTGLGAHRWQGQIQGKGASGGENVQIDKIWLFDVTEAYNVLRAPLSSTQGLSTYSARSEFNTESGVINGDSAAVGGAWASFGSATDVSVAAGVATRSATADVAATGRFVVSGAAAMTSQAVQVDYKVSVVNATSGGVLLRWTDINNWLRLRVEGQVPTTLILEKRVAGVVTELFRATLSATSNANAFYRVVASVNAAGVYALLYGAAGASLSLVGSGSDTALATGGALASGKPGFFDENTSSNPSTRTYDNFAAWVPQADAVAFASRSAQLATDSILRQDASGAAYGPVTSPEGQLPRIPVAGLEARSLELMALWSRGDLDQLPDAARTDSGTAQIFYRPSWLFVNG